MDESAITNSHKTCKEHVFSCPENNFHQKKNFKKLKNILEEIEHNHENFHTLTADEKDAAKTEDVRDAAIHAYYDLNNQLINLQKEQNQAMGYKWYGLIVAAVLTLVLSFKIICQIQYAVIDLKDPKTILEKLDWIPDDLTIDQIVTEDTFITAWDINNRSPRFFNKWSAKNQREPKNNHNMKFKQMIFASSS